MVVGAVAQVGEDVLGLGERRLADPGRALAAHLGEGHGLAVHPLNHVVAADAGQRPAALGHPGRAVVRAAGAEIGDALHRRMHGDLLAFLLLQEGDPLGDAGMLHALQQAAADDDGDLRRTFAGHGQRRGQVSKIRLTAGGQSALHGLELLQRVLAAAPSEQEQLGRPLAGSRRMEPIALVSRQHGVEA